MRPTRRYSGRRSRLENSTASPSTVTQSRLPPPPEGAGFTVTLTELAGDVPAALVQVNV